MPSGTTKLFSTNRLLRPTKFVDSKGLLKVTAALLTNLHETFADSFSNESRLSFVVAEVVRYQQRPRGGSLFPSGWADSAHESVLEPLCEFGQTHGAVTKIACRRTFFVAFEVFFDFNRPRKHDGCINLLQHLRKNSYFCLQKITTNLIFTTSDLFFKKMYFINNYNSVDLVWPSTQLSWTKKTDAVQQTGQQRSILRWVAQT